MNRILILCLATAFAVTSHATTEVFTGNVAGMTVSKSGTAADPYVMDFTAANVTGTIKLNGVSFVTLKGGTFASSVNNNCFDFNNTQSHDIVISGWTYTGPNGGTASFINGYFCYNLTAENNRIDNVSHFARSDSTLTHDVTIRNNYCRTTTSPAVQTDIIFFGDAYNVLVEGNQLINRAPASSGDQHNDVIQNYMKGGGNAGHPNGWVIRYNWIETQQTTGTGDCSWFMIEAMDGTPALKIYSNVFVGTGSTSNNGTAITRNNGGDYYCYNNTFIRHNAPDNTVRFMDAGKVSFRNNVMQSNPGVSGTWLVLSMKAASAFDYNFFYNSDGSAGAGPHGSTTKDPKFTNFSGNDFSLQSSSPLIGAGDSSIGAEYNQGIAHGATWPNPKLATRLGAWDVGAYVYNGGSPGPTPSPSATPLPTPSPSATPTPTPAPPKFKIGDLVTPTAEVNVRATPSGVIVGVHNPGDIGEVIDGPVIKDLRTMVAWYEITWGTAPASGWSGDDDLAISSAPLPTPTPMPSPTATPEPSATPTPGQTWEKWIKKQNDWIRANPPEPDTP
jgi:hypothetical protein